MEHKKNSSHYETVVHFIISRTPSDELGATKLNKVLWIADCLHWRETGSSLTGLDSYVRMPRGPVATNIQNVLNSLEKSGKIVEREVPTPAGSRREFVALKQPTFDELEAQQIDILHRAIEFVRPRSAKEISELSHDEYWEEVAHGGEMKVSAGSVWKRQHEPEHYEWARSEARKLGLA